MDKFSYNFCICALITLLALSPAVPAFSQSTIGGAPSGTSDNNGTTSIPISGNGTAIPNGVIILPDGTIQHDGLTITTNNTFIRGTAVNIPAGSNAAVSGSGTILADRILRSDGSAYHWPTQRIILANGSNILANGTTILPNGTSSPGTSGFLTNDGVQLSDGSIIAPGLNQSLKAASDFALTIPRNLDTHSAAQFTSLLPPAQLKNFFSQLPPAEAARILDATNFSPTQLAQFSRGVGLSGGQLGNILAQTQSLNDPRQLSSLITALNGQGFSPSQLEGILGAMGGRLAGIPNLEGFLGGLNLGSGAVGRLTNLANSGGAGAFDDGFGGNNAFAGNRSGNSGSYTNQALIGEEIYGAKSSVEIPHITTPLASLIANYSPHLYVKSVDQENAPFAYGGVFHRTDANSPRYIDSMLNFKNTTDGCAGDNPPPECAFGADRRFKTCVHQLKTPDDYNDMSIEQKAAYNRLRLDNCANQYILMSAAFPDVIDYPPDQRPLGNSAQNMCQPLQLRSEHLDEYDDRTTLDPGGLVRSGRNYLEEYIKGAWKKLLQDENHLIRGGSAPKEPSYNYGGDHEIASALTIEETLDGSFNLTSVRQLFENHPYEQIIDPTHPFSPRWDFKETEREKYSPRAHEGWDADEKNSVYCAGGADVVDEWDCRGPGCVEGQDDLHDMAVHVLDFREKEFENHMETRMRFNERCHANEISKNVKDLLGCFIPTPFGRIYFRCWSTLCTGVPLVHNIRTNNPPCAVNYTKSDSPRLKILSETAGQAAELSNALTANLTVGNFVNTNSLRNELINPNSALSQTVAGLGVEQFNSSQLLGNFTVRNLAGQLAPQQLLGSFGVDRLFALPNFQTALLQRPLSALSSTVNGVTNSVLQTVNFRNVISSVVPSAVLNFRSTDVLNAVRDTVGIAQFERLAQQGFDNIRSFEQLAGGAANVGTLIANPAIAAQIGQGTLNNVFANMNPANLFDLKNPQSVAQLRNMLGAPRFDQLRAAGQLEQALNTTMATLAGGPSQLNAIWQQRGVDNGLQGLTPSSFIESPATKSVVSALPLDASLGTTARNTLLQSAEFGNQVFPSVGTLGNLVGGASAVSSNLASNPAFLGQIQSLNTSTILNDLPNNPALLGSDLFQEVADNSPIDLMGRRGFTQNIGNLHNAIDPNVLGNMLDQFDADEFIDEDDIDDLRHIISPEQFNFLDSMSDDDLERFLENNPLSKVVGGNFTNAVANGDLIAALPADKLRDTIGDSSILESNEKLDDFLDSNPTPDDWLDLQACGSRSIKSICRRLTDPFAMINKLKLAHYSKEKHEEDPLSTELPLGVPEGLSYQEYFGVHRPYPASHETGKEHGQAAERPDVKTSTLGSEVAVVGVGRPTERCLFGGGGGAMAAVGVASLDPITSWTELKLYQARSGRKQLHCLTKFNKLWKPYFTEDPVLQAAGVIVPIAEVVDGQPTGRTTDQAVAEPWRGYCLDPNNDLHETGERRQFPFFPKDSASGITAGLDNAKDGDMLIFRNGTVGSGRPGLCTIGYVVGQPNPAVGDRPANIRIREANWGNYPDVCGITDAIDPHHVPSERILYKGRLPASTTQSIQEQTGKDASCEDTNLLNCALDERLWNDTEVYDPDLDKEGRYPDEPSS